ncbi:MAG TPA: RnfH family protein [Lysobacter sp.]|nr:RnfH family protein [Lysobacter sp.]
MRVSVVQAWPRRFQAVELELPAGACVEDALRTAGIDPAAIAGCAVFGERVALDCRLQPGDRVEVLRPLLADPKEARRRRVEARRPKPR